MTGKIFLCSDLDRTLLPNGRQPESPQARPLLRRLGQRNELTLAYVSGRHETLLKAAIDDYQLPQPDFLVGDVGTTIFVPQGGSWQPWEAWTVQIAGDWAGAQRQDLAALFSDIDELKLQEETKQNRFKLSYYLPLDTDSRQILAEMSQRLQRHGVRCATIWSIDEAAHIGLIDILPASATKLHAVRFLMQQAGFDEQQTVFAGDSGNDLPVVTSGLPSILVRNTDRDIIEQASTILGEKNLRHRLYVARGDFLGMNGYYSAGVLEGLCHFQPAVRRWLDTA